MTIDYLFSFFFFLSFLGVYLRGTTQSVVLTYATVFLSNAICLWTCLLLYLSHTPGKFLASWQRKLLEYERPWWIPTMWRSLRISFLLQKLRRESAIVSEKIRLSRIEWDAHACMVRSSAVSPGATLFPIWCTCHILRSDTRCFQVYMCKSPTR